MRNDSFFSVAHHFKFIFESEIFSCTLMLKNNADTDRMLSMLRFTIFSDDLVVIFLTLGLMSKVCSASREECVAAVPETELRVFIA